MVKFYVQIHERDGQVSESSCSQILECQNWRVPPDASKQLTKFLLNNGVPVKSTVRLEWCEGMTKDKNYCLHTGLKFMTPITPRGSHPLLDLIVHCCL